MQIFNNILKHRRGNWVIEGTGANMEEMIFNISAAHNAGYATSLIYIKCALTKIIVRNTHRARSIP